ncbi:MAG TPA: ribonuclease J [Eubacterium sp.]|jgi:ribonuclease J|uniref:ribonuclease J n=1 Tax=Lachnospira sp. TaxID=2049031 RepID=UPI000E8AF089|nr:ribonuclease J [Eubacterium sp.]HBS90256.1 ribonuclease J [Eubacterium sp.]HCH83686.1 ribonuclease J [Eubacterium sp.]
MKKENIGSVKVIPLGGLEQIGMNITAIEYDDSIVVVDCGLSFPEEEMLGIDLIIPDVTYLKDNIDKVKAFVITHGHEDHIGAIPYVLKEVNVPIYATRLTMGLIESKLKEHNMLREVKRKVVKYGQSVTLGDFRVEFIRTNHSIADAAAIAIFSPAGILVHTGDFKVDYTPVNGSPIDLQRFAELGKKGVLAVMCDSTNALRPGFTMSEKTVGSTFDKIFSDNKSNRIIIATFASNVDRVQQIINAAVAYGRKVCVEGRSMVNIIDVAEDLGYLHIPDGTLIETESMKNYTPEQIVLITTGSQGESMAALSRMAANLHRKVSIQPGDCVVFSSTPIPGNEKSVARVINELGMKGAKVIFQDTHVSGHACQEEIKLVYSLLKPKYAIPVHGEYRHLIAQKEVVMSLGYDKDHVIIAKSGDIIELNDEKAEIVGKAHTGAIFVDGLGVGDVGNIVLRDRQNLAENGIIIVVLTLEKYSGQLIAGPDIVTRGFVYVREAEELLNEAKAIVTDSVLRCLDKNITDWSKIKNIIKDDLSEYLWKKIKRNPVILPIIMEAQL